MSSAHARAQAYIGQLVSTRAQRAASMLLIHAAWGDEACSSWPRCADAPRNRRRPTSATCRRLPVSYGDQGGGGLYLGTVHAVGGSITNGPSGGLCTTGSHLHQEADGWRAGQRSHHRVDFEMPPINRFAPDWRRLRRWCLLGTAIMFVWLMAPVVKCAFIAFRDTPLSEAQPTIAAGEESQGFISEVTTATKVCYARTPLLGQESWKTNLLLGFAAATMITWGLSIWDSRRRKTFEG